MKKNEKITLNTIKKCKSENKKIIALTAYDYSTAKILDEAGIDIILVGDSLAMVALGYETTHSVTMEDMLYHTKAVSRGAQRALIIADMPFMSYQADISTAITNAGRFIKEAGAHAVKIEGGYDHIVSVIRRCTESGIPVLAHLGFTPQYLLTIGGYNIQGKNVETTKEILKQAREIERAGAFGLVLEMVPEESAKIITENLNIPTIGIGAGRYCSGQILVTDDIVGKYSEFTPKFARKYADIGTIMKNAVSNYKNDIQQGKFPSEQEVFNLDDKEKAALKSLNPESN